MGRALRGVYGCDEGVSVLEKARRAGNYHHSTSVGVAKGDTGHAHSAPWNPVFRYQSVRVSLIRREPAKT